MKLDSKKMYMIAEGDLLDDGTLEVRSVDGEYVLTAQQVKDILELPPRADDEPLYVFERVGTFTPDCKWVERA